MTAVALALLAAGAAMGAEGEFLRAQERFRARDYDAALSLLDRPAQSSDARAAADAWNLRGAIHLRRRNYAKAREAFRRAVELDPSLFAAKSNLAETDFRQGRRAEARAAWEALLAQTSGAQRNERDFLLYKISVTHALDGRLDLAADAAGKVRRRDDSPAWFYANAALAVGRRDRAQAEQFLARARQGPAAAAPAAQTFAESFQSVDASLAEVGRRASGPLAAAEPARVAPAPVAPKPAPPPPVESRPPVAAAAPPAPAPSRPRPPQVPAFVRPSAPPPAPAPAPSVARVTPAPKPEPAAPVEETVVARPPARSARLPADPLTAAAARAVPAATPTRALPPPPADPMPTPALRLATASTPGVRILTQDEGLVATALRRQREEAAAYAQLQSQGPVLAAAAPAPTPRATPTPAPKKPTPAAKPARTPPPPPSPEFLAKFLAASARYQERDLEGALRFLDEADAIQKDQADALNLRGQIEARRRDFNAAESAFRRAMEADPTLWAARFNYADAPFQYRNYSQARTRLEQLIAETDPATLPREAELAQFKLFLTLLLEGKEQAARTFMNRFQFNGQTPARYYAQAALNFYAGEFDKAVGWMSAARKGGFPPQIDAIFAESFYRIGWLTEQAPRPPQPTITPDDPLIVGDRTRPARTTVPAEGVAPTAEPPIPGAEGGGPPVAAAGPPTPEPSASAAPTPALAEATPAAPVPAPTPDAAQVATGGAASAGDAPAGTPAYRDGDVPLARAADGPVGPAVAERGPAARIFRTSLLVIVLGHVLYVMGHALFIFFTRRRARLNRSALPAVEASPGPDDDEDRPAPPRGRGAPALAAGARKA